MKKFESIFTGIFIYFFTFVAGVYSGKIACGNESVLFKAFCISTTLGLASLIVFIITKNDGADGVTSFIWRLKNHRSY